MRGWILALIIALVGLCGLLVLALLVVIVAKGRGPADPGTLPVQVNSPISRPPSIAKETDEEIARMFQKLYIEARKPRRWICPETDRAKLADAYWKWAHNEDNKWFDAEPMIELQKWVDSTSPALDKIVVNRGRKDRFHITGERTADGVWIEVAFVGTEKP